MAYIEVERTKNEPDSDLAIDFIELSNSLDNGEYLCLGLVFCDKYSEQHPIGYGVSELPAGCVIFDPDGAPSLEYLTYRGDDYLNVLSPQKYIVEEANISGLNVKYYVYGFAQAKNGFYYPINGDEVNPHLTEIRLNCSIAELNATVEEENAGILLEAEKLRPLTESYADTYDCFGFCLDKDLLYAGIDTLPDVCYEMDIDVITEAYLHTMDTGYTDFAFNFYIDEDSVVSIKHGLSMYNESEQYAIYMYMRTKEGLYYPISGSFELLGISEGVELPAIPARWSWTASNGGATAEWTQKAKAELDSAKDGGVNIKNFHYLVWNDIVSKVQAWLNFLGKGVNTEEAKMTIDDRTLYDTRYNAVNAALSTITDSATSPVRAGDELTDAHINNIIKDFDGFNNRYGG